MTHYFDTIRTKLDALDLSCASTAAEALDEIERELVHDVSVASMCPGFPQDLIIHVDMAILRHGVSTMPHDMVTLPRNDFEDAREHKRAIARLASDLHDVFHAVAWAGVTGFNDNPKTPVYRLFAGEADDRRDALAKRLGIGERRPGDPELLQLQVPAAPAEDDEISAASLATKSLLFCLQIYGGYEVKSRGPRGNILDAIAVLRPDVKRFLDMAWDHSDDAEGDAMRYFFPEDDEERSTVAPVATGVRFTETEMIVLLKGNAMTQIGVPIARYDWLAAASPRARANYQIVGGGTGIHWPELGKDIFVPALFAGGSSSGT